MKHIFFLFFVIGSFSILANDLIPPKKEGNIVGTWTNDYDHAVMEFKKEGNTYVGILIKPAKGHELDKNGNPRKNEKLISGLKYEDGNYVDGEIYIPKLDKYMNCDIKPTDEDSFKLNVRFGIMKRTVKWIRVK
jgi:uncharacterized protein (DUF2147 family)